MLVRFALLDRTVSLEEMLRGLGGGGGGGGGGAIGRCEPAPRRRRPPAPARRPVAQADAVADAPAADWRAVIRDADRAPTASARASTQRVERARRAPPRLRRAARAGAARSAAARRSRTRRWRRHPISIRSSNAGTISSPRLRAAGKSVAATALEHASPAAVNARGDVTIALDEANPIYEQAIESAKARRREHAARAGFPACSASSCAPPDSPAAPPTRLTDEMVRSERIAALRKQDPVLDAAIDALDLDLAD